jgi:hypothetical protein
MESAYNWFEQRKTGETQRRRGKMIELSLSTLILIIILAILVGILGLSLLAGHIVRAR